MVAVSGTGVSYIGTGLLENNTFITTDSMGTFSDIHCSSDSRAPYVGQWIAPSGVDITNATTDPFEVDIGDQRDPGSLVIQQRNGHIVTRSFQGVYTCIIPDKDGVEAYWHVGIYSNGFNSKFLHVDGIASLPHVFTQLQLPSHH